MADYKDHCNADSAGGNPDEVADAQQEGSCAEPAKADTPAPEWMKGLVRTKKGDIASTQANITSILRYHPEWAGVLAYDEFREEIVTTKPPSWCQEDCPAEVKAGTWGEEDTARLVNWLERQSGIVNTPQSRAEAAYTTVAHTKRIHPVREYLRSLKWDQKPRLDRLLVDYFGAEDTEYTRGVGSRWMISAVARIMRPGCQADCTLVLESDQGAGKSSGFRSLVPDARWYTDTPITMGDKDSYENLRGIWIYGLDELTSLVRAELNKMKNFLTQTKDHYRPSYGRRAKDFPRQCVFAGTTNDEHYLVDTTGNRRFWPVRVNGAADVKGIEADRDQLWAEAYARFSAGEAWHVDSREFRELCEAEQREREASDPWEEPIAAWLAKPTDNSGRRVDREGGVLVPDILQYAIRVEIAKMSKADEARVSKVLKRLGYKRGKKHRENGVEVRRWSKQKPVSVVSDPVAPQDTESTSESMMRPVRPGKLDKCRSLESEGETRVAGVGK